MFLLCHNDDLGLEHILLNLISHAQTFMIQSIFEQRMGEFLPLFLE